MNAETVQPIFPTQQCVPLQQIFDLSTYVPRAGKSTIVNDLMADMVRAAKESGTCGPLAGGMTTLLRAMQEHYLAAGGSLMVIDKGPSLRGMHSQVWSAACRMDRAAR
jgi:hypothetical protein